jgi:chromosome segregation ATPase
LDVLRETADKVSKYEASIEAYKKKLEDLGDLRRQVKMLEEKNTDYMQRNMELEEDVKKTGNWRPQVDAYKKQIAELHARLDSETKKSDRLEFETKRMLEKVEALSVERGRLQTEKEDLKSKNDELTDEIKFGQATGVGGGRRVDGEPDSGKEDHDDTFFVRSFTLVLSFQKL